MLLVYVYPLLQASMGLRMRDITQSTNYVPVYTYASTLRLVYWKAHMSMVDIRLLQLDDAQVIVLRRDEVYVYLRVNNRSGLWGKIAQGLWTGPERHGRRSVREWSECRSTPQENRALFFPFGIFRGRSPNCVLMSEEKPDEIPAIQINHHYKVHFGR